MKFQSYRLILGHWRDPDSGKTIDGITGLVSDSTVEAPSVQMAMRKLRTPLNPSPIVSVIDDSDLWARSAVRRLMQ